MNSFDEWVCLFKKETEEVKIRKEFAHLLFLVVYPDDLKWDFGVEKQTQTTTVLISGGVTGASHGHDIQFCRRSQVDSLLLECKHTHAMIVSVGVVFDMGKFHRHERITPISDFYEFAESGEYCKAHIIAKPDKPAFLHHQHINLNIAMWKSIGVPPLNETWKEYERSDENHHDDYTPFWLEPKDRPRIQNFTTIERTRKAFSYYRTEIQNLNWKYIANKEYWKVDINKDTCDNYFDRFRGRMESAFYVVNNETVRPIEEEVNFDLIISPTAGYSTEVFVNAMDFRGEVIFYDYTQYHLDIKRQIIEMNMSLKDIFMLERIVNFEYNRPRSDAWRQSGKSGFVGTNPVAYARTKSMGAMDELQGMQEKMYNTCEIEYWLLDLITPDYNKILEKVKGKNVFFNASNIFSYHMTHATYTLEELASSYYKLKDLLSQTKTCYFRAHKPTKQQNYGWL